MAGEGAVGLKPGGPRKASQKWRATITASEAAGGSLRTTRGIREVVPRALSFALLERGEKRGGDHRRRIISVG